MPQLKLRAVHTSFFDLGYYTSLIHGLAINGEGGLAFQGHSHLLVMPYVWLYRLFPGPAALLVLQSTILVATAWLAAEVWHRFGAGSRQDGALLYFLSLSVWFGALFDFHFEHLVFPLFFGAMLASQSPRLRYRLLVVACGLALAFVKEAYALMAAGLGVYLVLARRQVVTGGILALFGIVYFFVMTEVVIAFFSGGQNASALWNTAFGHLGSSTTDALIYIGNHPVRVFQDMLTPRKILYMGVLGGTFAFVWIRAPLVLIPAIPIGALSLLSHNTGHYYLGNQYTIGVVAPLFVATAMALGRMRARNRKIARRLVLAASAASLVLFGPSPLSRLFVQNATWNYGASAYVPTPRDILVRRVIAQTIPRGQNSAVAIQNSLVTPELVARKLVTAFPDGVFEPYIWRLGPPASLAGAFAEALTSTRRYPAERKVLVRWVVLDMKRAWFVRDRGCAWRHGACTDQKAAAAFRQAIGRLPALFDLVVDRDGLQIYRRR